MRIVFLFCFLAGNLSLSAQTYLKFEAGYAISATPENQGVSSNLSTGFQESLNGSTGQGLSVALGLGYNFSANFAGELDIQYFGGDRYTQEDTQGPGFSSMQERYTQQIRIAPSFVVVGNNTSGVAPYARFGVVIPISGTTFTQVEIDDVPNEFGGTYDQTALAETKGQFSLGFQAGLGLTYDLGNNLSFFGEARYVGLSIKASSSEIIEFNREDIIGPNTVVTTLADLPMSQTNIEYSDELDSSSNDGSDTSRPTDELAPLSNYDSFGITIGLRKMF